MEGNVYRLFQRNVCNLLRTGGILTSGQTIDGLTFFRTCIPIELSVIASEFGCSIRLNPDRMQKAHSTWDSELSRQQIDGGGIPDQFKHAGLLAYWLRRLQVVDECSRFTSYDTDLGKKQQTSFLNAPCEIAAFILAYNLAAFYTFESYRRENYTVEMFMRDTRPNSKYISDIGIYLKDKHVSPHSLFLIYEAFLADKRYIRKVDNI